MPCRYKCVYTVSGKLWLITVRLTVSSNGTAKTTVTRPLASVPPRPHMRHYMSTPDSISGPHTAAVKRIIWTFIFKVPRVTHMLDVALKLRCIRGTGTTAIHETGVYIKRWGKSTVLNGNVDRGVTWQMCNMRKEPLKKTKDTNTGCYSCQAQLTHANKEERQTWDLSLNPLVTMRTDLPRYGLRRQKTSTKKLFSGW